MRRYPHLRPALAFLLLAAPASSQQPPSRADKVAADALFDDARRLLQQGNTSEACPKFEESQRLDPGVGTLLYLGDCYEKAGRFASAWTTFREAAGAARLAGQADREKTAQRLATALESKLSRLLLAVPGKDAQPDLVVKRNGVAVSRALWDTPLPIDPGPQLIEASAPGKKPWQSRLEGTPAGQTLTVQIPKLEPLEVAPAPTATATTTATAPPPPPPTTSAPPPAPPPTLSTDSAGSRRTLALVAGGIGLVSVGVGSYFGLRTFSLWSDAKAGCPQGRCETDGDYDKAAQAQRSGTISTVLFGIGAVGLGAGAYLWLTAPSNPSTAFAPSLTPHGGSFSIRRSW